MVTCVYHAYENDQLVATGRLTLDDLPHVGEEVRFNGRPHVVRSVEFGGGEHVLRLWSPGAGHAGPALGLA